MNTIFRCLLVFLLGVEVFAQKDLDADASFLQARNIAFEGNWDVARDSLNHLLEVYPNYTDAKILIAKTYSWNGNYDKARRHFNRITSIEKEQKDAWFAAIKNEVYAKNLNIALGLANKALIHLKNDTEIQQLRNQLMEDMTKELPIQDKLKEDNREEHTKNQIAVSSNLEVFDIVFDPMYLIVATDESGATFVERL